MGPFPLMPPACDSPRDPTPPTFLPTAFSTSPASAPTSARATSPTSLSATVVWSAAISRPSRRPALHVSPASRLVCVRCVGATGEGGGGRRCGGARMEGSYHLAKRRARSVDHTIPPSLHTRTYPHQRLLSPQLDSIVPSSVIVPVRAPPSYFILFFPFSAERVRRLGRVRARCRLDPTAYTCPCRPTPPLHRPEACDEAWSTRARTVSSRNIRCEGDLPSVGPRGDARPSGPPGQPHVSVKTRRVKSECRRNTSPGDATRCDASELGDHPTPAPPPRSPTTDRRPEDSPTRVCSPCSPAAPTHSFRLRRVPPRGRRRGRLL